MRLGLFSILVFGLLASSWALNLPLPSSTIRNRDLAQNLNSTSSTPESLLLQQNGNEETGLGRENSSSSSRVVPKNRGRYTRLLKRIYARFDSPTSNCSRVTERQIQSLNFVLQGALRKISSLDDELEEAIDLQNVPSSSSSRSRQPSAKNMNNNILVSSHPDQCERMLLEMKGATEEMTKLAQLLHENLETDDETEADAAVIGRLKTALETQMSQLNSSTVNLETQLSQNQGQNRNRYRKWGPTLTNLSQNVGDVKKLVDVLKSQAEKLELRIQNYKSTITQIRGGNLTAAILYYHQLRDFDYGLLKSIVQEAYDGQTFVYYRRTLGFSRFLPSFKSQEAAYTALFEKVKTTTLAGAGTGYGTFTPTPHKSDKQVLFSFSACIVHSIEERKRSNVPVTGVLTEMEEELEEMITEEFLDPWAVSIRQGNHQSVLHSIRVLSNFEWDLTGFRPFFNLLIEKAYDDSDSNFHRTLDFVKGLQSPRLRAMGLRQLFDLWNLEGHHGTKLAFQVKKLLDSVSWKNWPTEDESFANREMTELKADLPSWERLAVWGGGTCHIQNYYYDEYLGAPSDSDSSSEEAAGRKLFTWTSEQEEEEAEWTFHTSEGAQGAFFQIRSRAHQDELIEVHRDYQVLEVYLKKEVGLGIGFGAEWIIQRVTRGDDSSLFTIRNVKTGQYLYAGPLKRGGDKSRRPVITISEHSTSSDRHLWTLRCDDV